MEPDRPGWYHDSRRPGLRRYWDGHAWIDVDQIVEDHAEPSPVAAAPFVVAQRRPDQDVVRPAEIVDEVEESEPGPQAEPLAD